MSEKEPLEQYLTPEFWDGHSPNDDCEWTSSPKKGFIPEINNRLRLNKTENRVRSILDLYVAQGDITIARSFTEKGEIFDGNKFPDETILRFHLDMLTKFKKNKDLEYDNFIFLGVILRSSDPVSNQARTSIFATRESLLRMGGKNLPLLEFKPYTEIKEVIHRRDQIGKSNSRGEYFSRCNFLQVVKMGKPAYEPERVKAGFSGILTIPQRQI